MSAGHPSLPAEIERQANRNRTLTFVLAGVALLNVFIIAIVAGAVAHDGAVLLLALAIVVGWLVCAYFFYNATVLRATRARDLRADERARLEPIVGRLAGALDVPAPRLLAIDDDACNAFAVGTGTQATVVFSTGLLRLLDDEELEGVAAHEVAHIANGDTRLALLSAAMLGWAVFVSAAVTVVAFAVGLFGVGFITSSTDNGDGDFSDKLAAFLAKLSVGLGLIAAAVAGWLIGQAWFMVSRITHLGISRQREWLADATAARVTAKPLALARALEKVMHAEVELAHGQGLARALCVVAPLRSGQWWRDLFDTHPDVLERIARLKRYAPER